MLSHSDFDSTRSFFCVYICSTPYIANKGFFVSFGIASFGQMLKITNESHGIHSPLWCHSQKLNKQIMHFHRIDTQIMNFSTSVLFGLNVIFIFS